jgi:hypothetical protein
MMPPAVSVWPYISHTLTPSICQTVMVSAGSGAPPDTTSSSLPKPILLSTRLNTAARQAACASADNAVASFAQRRLT